VVFVFASVNMLYYIYCFVNVEPLLHPWNETDLITVHDLFDMLSNLVCSILLRSFASVLNKEINIYFFFCCVQFWDKYYMGFIELECASVPSVSISWKN
jgi:hypothetical protein